ncbi:hypothetical protein NM208_g5919 [Fusarium decemcellulare]|uniref:Uncharacterized protein n=1 Tax=Fusarium decemcellulare TaxID=57161 RepID=A0ACC1SFB5_9HYPO|nr:hypothetical protein NM208_g5919 [Fusarium decemcellulare]
MGEIIANLLPYSQTSHPTLAAARETRQILAHALLPELARPIAYKPWLVKRRDDEQEHRAGFSRQGTGDSYSIAALYLSTERIPTGLTMVAPQRIIFQTRAADQGWATFGGDGTFDNSHTWFEASILRPLDSRAPNEADASLEDILQDTWWDVSRARNELMAHGWDFVEGPDERIAWRVCNNLTASGDYQNYKVEWTRGVETNVENERAVGRGEGFLELLQPGCIVVLWARAEQLNWVNHVAAATIEIEYDFL